MRSVQRYRSKRRRTTTLIASVLTFSCLVLVWNDVRLPTLNFRRLFEATTTDVSREDAAEIADLRIAALGASVTWGSTLPDRRNQAYPFLLSPRANNAALRATGPNYPSLCTPSLLGNDTYDVIVLEYFHRADEGLATLARRIRKRFPDAIIVVTRIWYPLQIKSYHGGDVRDWAWDRFGHGSDGRNLRSREFLKELMFTDEEMWYVHSFEPEKKLQEVVLEEIGGHLYVMPFPESHPKEAIRRHRNWFAKDWHHLSPEGHEEVARGIREILKRAIETYDPETARLGPWGDDDDDGGDGGGGLERCGSWFETGEVTFPHSPNAEIEMFDARAKKYALIVPPEGATLTIDNPDEDGMPRPLHLAYMTNAPLPSLYPVATVYINGVRSKRTLRHRSDSELDHPIHVPVTVEVGRLKPGVNEVTIVPSSGETTEKPFRLTGAVIGPRYLSLDADGVLPPPAETS